MEYEIIDSAEEELTEEIKDDKYYFFNVTYAVTNNVTLDMPASGANETRFALIMLYIGIAMILGAGLMAFGRKKKEE